VDGSAAFGGIKPFSQQATLPKAGKGLNREKQSPQEKIRQKRRWQWLYYFLMKNLL